MTISNSEDIGNWIRSERKRQGLTQKQLCGLIGVNERFIVEVEKGKATAELGKVLHVLKSLGANIDITRRGE